MDIATSVIQQMSPLDKQKVFAAIAREFVVISGANMIPVSDDISMIGFFIPIGSKAEIITPQEKSPYLDEIRERARSPENSITLEEFLNRLDVD